MATRKKKTEQVEVEAVAETATASGDSGAATASGYCGKARGKDGCALFLVFRGSNRKIIHAKAAIVGKEGIKADVFYQLNAAGNFQEIE